MLIPLSDWAAKRYAVPPAIATLRRWVKEGQIQPPPERAGRMYQVDENAVRVTGDTVRLSLVQRLQRKEHAA